MEEFHFGTETKGKEEDSEGGEKEEEEKEEEDNGGDAGIDNMDYFDTLQEATTISKKISLTKRSTTDPSECLDCIAG